MKKIIILILTVFLFQYYYSEPTSPNTTVTQEQKVINSDVGLVIHSAIESAYKNKRNNVQVEGYGTVIRLLADDNKGSRHQKFILRLPSGQTILIAHNIDLASKIRSLSKGDNVQFYGEYEWNNKGGVVHWTHQDPNAKHVAGWLKHKGRTYQ